jgi:hypothetical protein
LNPLHPDDSQRLDALTNELKELREQQERLEERLARLEKQSPAEATASRMRAKGADNLFSDGETVVSPVSPLFPPAAETATLESKVGLTIVNRIGAITLVLGVAFFFKWAVDNDWIGPTARVALGVLAGIVTLAVGELIWRRRQAVFAQGITASGIAIVFLATYAAFNFYHLLPQSAAFLAMTGAVVLAAMLAWRYNSVAIAALGWAAGYATPLLLSAGDAHPWFLFSYVLLLNSAATELGARRQWRGLEIVSFSGTVVIYGGWLLYGGTKDERLVATLAPLAFLAERWRTQIPLLFALGQFLTAVALTFVWPSEGTSYLLVAAAGLVFADVRGYRIALISAFVGFWLCAGLQAAPAFFGATCGFVLFFGWSFWQLVWKRAAASAVSLAVFALNGIVYYARAYWQLRGDHREWLGGLAVLVAVVYLGLGFVLQRQKAEERPVVLALGMAAGFLTLAIPLQFVGFTITMAWAMQGAVLAWIGGRLASTRALYAALLVFALVGGRLLLFEWGSLGDAQTYSLVWNTRFLTFAVSAAALLLAAWWGWKVWRGAGLATYFAGHAFLLLGLSLEITGWAERSVAAENRLSAETIGISILFGVYAVMLVSAGVATRTAVNRLAGLGLMGIVILKLYLFDVWQLTRPYQILAFVILGVLLLATSFLYSNFRRLMEGWWKDGNP